MEIRDAILMQMDGKIDAEQMKALTLALDMVLHDYNIEKKCYDIAVCDADMNEKLIKQYVASKRLEGLSEKSIKQYYRTVNEFLDVVRKPIKDITVSDITVSDIRYYMATYQVQRKISNTTLDNYRLYLSSFFAWLVNEEYIDKNPMLKIKCIKEDDKKREPFTDEELEKLRNACVKPRDRALIEFLYSTGCRIGEVVRLNRDSIDYNAKTALVYGKGGKERRVYISDCAMYWLKMYLEQRKDKDPALFCSIKGRISDEGAEYIVKNLGKKVGIRAFPHRFRHTIASNLAKRGMPVQEIQKFLGHASIDTTMIYCSVVDDNVKNSHNKYAA